MPHEKWGKSPHAFIVYKAGVAATVAELWEFARDRLAHFEVPQGFHSVTDLPKTATGKIQKYILRGGKANLAK